MCKGQGAILDFTFFNSVLQDLGTGASEIVFPFRKPVPFCHPVSAEPCHDEVPVPPPEVLPETSAKGNAEHSHADTIPAADIAAKQVVKDEEEDGVENVSASSLPAVGKNPAPEVPCSSEGESPLVSQDPPPTEGEPPLVSEDPPPTEGEPPLVSQDPPPTEGEPPLVSEDPPATEDNPLHPPSKGPPPLSKHLDDENKVCLP